MSDEAKQYGSWLRQDVQELRTIVSRLEKAVSVIEAQMHYSPCPLLQEMQMQYQKRQDRKGELIVRVLTYFIVGLLGWLSSLVFMELTSYDTYNPYIGQQQQQQQQQSITDVIQNNGE